MEPAAEYVIGVKAWPAYVLVGGVVQVVAMGWSAWRVSVLVRHPPRLWLLPTATYVLVPWPRVLDVRTAVKGLGRGLFVYVHGPEEYGGGDLRRLRRIRRAMRQFYGTPFVYPLRRGAAGLRDADAAVLHFSQGVHRVIAAARHG